MTNSRWSFSKRAFEQPIEVQVLAGGQTTLSGKDTAISPDKLQAGRNSIDSSASVHVSVFDSPSLHKFVESMGGTEAVEKLYINNHLDRDALINNNADDSKVINEEYEPIEIHSPKTLVYDQEEEDSSTSGSPPMISKFRHLHLDELRQDRVHNSKSVYSGVKDISYDSDATLHNCVNIDCSKLVPNFAKFCPHCGSAQLSKFCMECSREFQGKEKFCPDCGTPR